MAGDIKLIDNNIIVEGNLGVGTETPLAVLHVEGSEIYSSGPVAGFAFADRHPPNHRWVWYADGGTARLFVDGTGDRLTIDQAGTLTLSEAKLGVMIGNWQGGERLAISATEVILSHPSIGGGSFASLTGAHELTIGKGFESVKIDGAKLGVITGNWQGGERLAISATEVALGHPSIGGGYLASVTGAHQLTIGKDFTSVNIEGTVHLVSGGTHTVLAPLPGSGLEIVDRLLPIAEKHSICITATGILVSIPTSESHPDPSHPQPATQTLDLIAEVKALRQEVNALRAKVGI
jgi:hypothetical protein